jgi:hypothetical protein
MFRSCLIVSVLFAVVGAPTPLPILHITQHTIPIHQAQIPARRYTNVRAEVLKLDSWTGPWLSEYEFRTLFTKCLCGFVMTHRVFKYYHVCTVDTERISQSPGTITDLASDTSDDFGENRSGRLTAIDLTMASDDDLQ